MAGTLDLQFHAHGQAGTFPVHQFQHALVAVCEEIVTRHEGRLDIGNAQGGGCLVTIVLPIET